MVRETHKEQLKEWERVEKEKKSGYVCGCFDCGGLVTYNKEYKVWCCGRCNAVVSKDIIKKLTRVF